VKRKLKDLAVRIETVAGQCSHAYTHKIKLFALHRRRRAHCEAQKAFGLLLFHIEEVVLPPTPGSSL